MKRTDEQQNIITLFKALLPDEVIQVAALAGTGKTTLLEELVKELDADFLSETLLCAFSREIKTELERRIKGCVIKTNHGLGFAALMQFHYREHKTKWGGELDANKYRRLLDIWADNHTMLPEVKDHMPKLIDMVRVCHVDYKDIEAVERLIVDREIEISEDMEAVMQCLSDVINWGINGLPKADKFGKTYHWHYYIDFVDQLYLPYALEMPIPKYRYVFVDECQDFERSATMVSG